MHTRLFLPLALTLVGCPPLVDIPCDDRCDRPGSTRCSGGQLSTCQDQGNGCTAWSSPTACAGGTCLDATHCQECQGTCDSAGATRCIEGQSATCEAGVGGCLTWGQGTVCPDGFCADGSNCGTCPGNTANCDGDVANACEVDLDIDPSHCGSCATVCEEGEVCIRATCVGIARLAAGWAHTCALLSNGELRCWGENTYGQLGYGHTRNIGDDEPPKDAGSIDLGGIAVDVSAGKDHTCAILEGGSVKCWGYNYRGQLGYGNQIDYGDDEVPAAIATVDVGGVVAQLALGEAHTCALLGDGRVRCWGWAYDGQLGYGNQQNIGDNEHPSSAGDVNVGGTVYAVAAGAMHTCALLATGAVRCWGYNAKGQLGLGHVNDVGDDEQPAPQGDIVLGGPVDAIACGHYHTCARMQTGRIRCFGNGTSGRLGYMNDTTIGDDELPATAGDVNLGDLATALVAGGNHSCIIRTQPRLRCWGFGGQGALGYGNTLDVGSTVEPVLAGDVKAGGDVIQVVAGERHTCALLTGNRVRCWGTADSGQLGTGNTIEIGDDELPDSISPVQIY